MNDGCLLAMLDRYGGLQATDPRDRVYGLLGLAIDSPEEELDVDYGLSVRDVYISVAKFIVRRYHTLDFLCLICRPRGILSQDLPSWCPDWSTRKIGTTRLKDFQASVTRRCLGNAISPDGRLLRAHGVLVDKIHTVCLPDGTTEVTKLSIKVAMNMWKTAGAIAGQLQSSRSKSIPCSPVTPYDALRNALVGASSGPPELKAEDADAFLVIMNEFSKTEEICDLTIVSLLSIMQLRTRNRINHPPFRKFSATMASDIPIVSTTGLIGLSTSVQAFVGDEIWILFGCPKPMILRPVDGNYQAIGPLHMEGIMNGEVIGWLENQEQFEGLAVEIVEMS